MRVVEVRTGERPYQVHIGSGALNLVDEMIDSRASKVAIITQENIGWHITTTRRSLTINIANGESAKTLSVVEEICRKLAVAGFGRADVVVGVGGGVVTDVAGFVAAIYHRGMKFMNVSTTLLGQVDAAIGGKTGVNLIEGKNLVGVFWQPQAVICDTDTLSTLPVDEYRSGLGEVAKYHFLGSTLPKPTKETTPSGHAKAVDAATIAACVQIKADVVAADERESGNRAILNYGHTLAHALETAGQYSLRHGEAVAVGIAYAGEVAYLLGRINTQRLAEHYQVLAHYGLPHALPEGANPEKLLQLFSRDKKAISGLTMVLDGPHGVEVQKGIDPNILRAALDKMQS